MYSAYVICMFIFILYYVLILDKMLKVKTNCVENLSNIAGYISSSAKPSNFIKINAIGNINALKVN